MINIKQIYSCLVELVLCNYDKRLYNSPKDILAPWLFFSSDNYMFLISKGFRSIACIILKSIKYKIN